MIKSLIKNESVCVPDESEDIEHKICTNEYGIQHHHDPSAKSKLFSRASYENNLIHDTAQSCSSGSYDTNETEKPYDRRTYTSPCRISFKDKFMIQKKLDFYLESANKITRAKKPSKNGRV